MKIITAALLVLALGTAPVTAHADDVIVVPFGGDVSGDRAALGSELATATVDVLTLAPRTSAQIAQAPREDILTLAGCPDGAKVCIGQLAATLDVDRAATGVVIAAGNRIDIELRLVHRDGVIVTHVVRVEGTDRALVVGRYKTALAQKLGLARPTPAIGVPDRARFKPVAPVAQVRRVEAVGIEPADSPPPRYDRPTRGASLSQIGTGSWVTLGIGVVGLGLGTAFLIKAGRTEDEILAAPSRTNEDLQALRELEDRGDSEKTTGAAMLVIGLVATAAGGALVVRDLMREDNSSSGVAIGPVDRGEGVSVSLRRSF